MIRNDKILHVFTEGRRSHCVLKALVRAQRWSAAPCRLGSWGPGLTARQQGRGFARQGPAGMAAGDSQSPGRQASLGWQGRAKLEPGTRVSKPGSGPGLVSGLDTASGRQAKPGSQPVGRGLGADQQGPRPGTGTGMAATRVGLHLRQGRALELRLKGSSHRRGPALAEATLQSCLAAPHSHQREGGAALSCTISKLALSPAAKSPGGGCNQGPYSHLRSQGAATLFCFTERHGGRR